MSETKQSLSRSQRASAEVTALLRSRHTLLWIVTREEARAEASLIEAAINAKYNPRTWDCASGTKSATGKRETFSSNDIGETLNTIEARANATNTNRGTWILRDAHEWLQGPIGIQTRRQLRNLARTLSTTVQSSAQNIIILSPSSVIPDELLGHCTVLDWPPPDKTEIAQILDDTIEGNRLKGNRLIPLTNGARESAIDAAIGLSGDEAANCYAKSVVTTRAIDVKLISAEKKRIITRERVLEWCDPIPGGLDAVGGLAELKRWLTQRAQAYSPAFRRYAPRLSPRGVLLVGISGCGKSLVAKAIATNWGVPLLKFDFGALKGKFVGESEGKIRKARQVIESIGRCVVWFDEIEKGLGGMDSADGGVSLDQIGFLLTWMQEREGDAFLAATSNDVSRLPPELFRKGRFDEIFSVDIPNELERQEIICAALREYGRGHLVENDAIDTTEIGLATVEFTGAEIAGLVPDALYAAFAEGAREINTADILSAASRVVPLTKTAAEKVAEFRKWAAGRARPASEQAQSNITSSSRQFDL